MNKGFYLDEWFCFYPNEIKLGISPGQVILTLYVGRVAKERPAELQDSALRMCK